MDASGIKTLVVLVGGPADGDTRYVSLNELKNGLVVSGTRYLASQSIPPEVVDTAEGGAEVMRPER